MAADVGDKTWTAVGTTAISTGGGTSAEDIRKYAVAGGQAAAAAACAGYGPVASAGCGYVGGAVAGVIVDLGVALFGSSSPGLNDIYNPIADRIVARLVLLKRGQKADDAAIHALGEQGVRNLVNSPDGKALAIQWAKAANAADAAAQSPIRWWYDGKDAGQPGRMRLAAIQQWVQMLAGLSRAMDAQRWSAQIPKGMVQAAATVAARNTPGADGVEKPVEKNSASSGPGWGTLLLVLAGIAAVWKRKEIARALTGKET